MWQTSPGPFSRINTMLQVGRIQAPGHPGWGSGVQYDCLQHRSHGTSDSPEVARIEELPHIRRRAIRGKDEVRFGQGTLPVDLVNQHFEVTEKVTAVVLAAGAGCRPRLSYEGAWHSTQCSILFLVPPCAWKSFEKTPWQATHLVATTTMRRGTGVVSVTAK